MSLLKFKQEEGKVFRATEMKELEIIELNGTAELSLFDHEGDGPRDRKSARARFGTNKIGSVSLPLELQSAIQRVIDGK